MITSTMFLAFLHCERMAFLKSVGSPGDETDFQTITLEQNRLYETEAQRSFLKAFPENDILHAPSSLATALIERPRVIVNATIQTEDIYVQIPILERVAETGKRGGPAYCPVHFVRENKITSDNKMVLAFAALALASIQGVIPHFGTLIHGNDNKTARVKLEPFVKQVRRLLPKLKAIAAGANAPTLTLNRHCNMCEFRAACHKVAEETDNLSLMRGMSETEINKQRSRGISTITQFSHTFHPGRRGKRRTGKARKHDHALQALAFRDDKVYVLDSPSVPKSGVAMYLDVEGVPDRDLY